MEDIFYNDIDNYFKLKKYNQYLEDIKAGPAHRQLSKLKNDMDIEVKF